MSNWRTADDRELLQATRRDPQAFGAFYARHERRLLVYLLRRTGSSELAADLCAEVFAVALEACRDGDERPQTPVAWLFGIANHKLADSVRRRQVDDRARRRLQMRSIELSRGQLCDIEQLAHEDEASTLLAELSAEQREAVLARIVDDRAYPEIARQLRCSESVVRKRVSRALAILRAARQEPR
jgi:RNA polymerase sigma-70 factor (ECF subfamily)